MSLHQIKHTFKRHLINLPGWRTKRKIVVIESDDWGAERTPSKDALIALKKSGVEIDRCRYMINDSLASEKDLTSFFEVLSRYKDFTGQHPVITANCLMVNPDFEKIRADNFQKYYFEHFTKTLRRYPEHQNSFALWTEGIKYGVFHPQSHGREHLNISRWMRDLQNGNKETRKVFQLGFYGVSGHIIKQKRGTYLAAFDGGEKEIKYDRDIVIAEALQIFWQTFGYHSKSFIAPNYVWDKKIEQALYENKVEFIQGMPLQNVSKDFGDPVKLVRHYQGQRNNLGQRYLMRNAHFEPSSSDKDWVNNCLAEINSAFKWHKPCIISTHRVNFIGFINPANRSCNLRLFDRLLSEIIKQWPDVEFMTSDRLGKMMNENE